VAAGRSDHVHQRQRPASVLARTAHLTLLGMIAPGGHPYARPARPIHIPATAQRHRLRELQDDPRRPADPALDARARPRRRRPAAPVDLGSSKVYVALACLMARLTPIPSTQGTTVHAAVTTISPASMRRAPRNRVGATTPITHASHAKAARHISSVLLKPE